MTQYNKILIIENEHERYAKNHNEVEFASVFFKNLPIEYWYRFNLSFTDEKKKSMVRITSIPETTLLVTYTTFANGALSGYGDLIGGWLRFFSTLPNKIHFCVMCSPELKWQLLGWIGDANGKREVQKRLIMANETIARHNFYSFPFSFDDDTGFKKQATLLDSKWMKENYFKEESIIKYKGKDCRLGSFNQYSQTPKYTLWVPTGRGSYTLKDINLSTLKRIKK